MKTNELFSRGALASVLVLLAAGCDQKPLESSPVTCAPDGAVATFDARSYDVAPRSDGGAGPSDGPLPDGITTQWELPASGMVVAVALGLRADIEAALGFRPGSDFGIGDKVIVAAGYGEDLVFMKGGSIGPPSGTDVKPGVIYPMVLSFGGFRTYAENPNLQAHPEFASARALFDAMTNVSETSTEDGRTRESPGGRARCSVPPNLDAAFCTFTGFRSAHVF